MGHSGESSVSPVEMVRSPERPAQSASAPVIPASAPVRPDVAPSFMPGCTLARPFSAFQCAWHSSSLSVSEMGGQTVASWL